MLNDCQKYVLAINAKETPFLTEPLIYGSSLLLAQHKMMLVSKENEIRPKGGRRKNKQHTGSGLRDPFALQVKQL
jgi:hypothetical protein